MTKESLLYELIFFVTSHCNSRCRHCFNWQNLNQKEDLSLELINDLSKKLPRIKNLLLSGGEPFLRNDLAELIDIFVRNNKIETISIPTNGLLTNKIVDVLEKILQIPGTKAVNINFSLDGLLEVHDKIRGVKNNYVTTVETINRVIDLKNKYSHLNILVNSVIGGENQAELLKLADSLMLFHPRVDAHYFEIIRPTGPGDLGKLNFSYDFYKELIKRQYEKFKKCLDSGNLLKSLSRKFLFLGRMNLIYGIQYRNYFSKKNWPFACSAGKNIVVLNDRGLLSVCESRNTLFNLADYKDFADLSSSKTYQDELNDLLVNSCFCTHSCFIDASIQYHLMPKKISALFLGVISFIRYEIISRHSDI